MTPSGAPVPASPPSSPPVAIKICGLTRPGDAEAAARLGADWVGVILVPGTPRVRSPEEARSIAVAAGRPLVVVVAGETPESTARMAERAGAAAIQFHGDASPEELGRLRERGAWELWKAVRVRAGDKLLDQARRWHGAADLLLLDGWHPTQLGGTGTVFPWEALETVRSAWPPSLGLGVAGGLTPATVGEAMRRLRPNLVDVSSGVEARPGEKDPDKLRAFFHAARPPIDPPPGAAPGPASDPSPHGLRRPNVS